MGSLGDVGAKVLPPRPSDPLFLEINRIENKLRDKERELGLAHSEIKSLKTTEILKDKAIAEISIELRTYEEKLRIAEKNFEYKNLEIKRLADEKKEALAAQFAAETTLRRLYAAQKDEESLPIEAVTAPLESEIRLYKGQITSLQEDKKALERLMKSKEAALFEAQKILENTLERALIIEDLQNQNLELRKRIEIFQEENKLLEKSNHQKVMDVQKLTQTVHDLQESILAGGIMEKTVRDYQRQVSELNEEKKSLERELARAKVSANRVAVVVANAWKDENDKVMPVKQWLDERRLMQAEVQRLRDKIITMERTAKAEVQLKDKLRLRLKILEEGMKQASSLTKKEDEKIELACESPTQKGELKKKAEKLKPGESFTAHKNFVCGKIISTSVGLVENANAGNLQKNNLLARRLKLPNSSEKENTEANINVIRNVTEISKENKANGNVDIVPQLAESRDNSEGSHEEDLVSGFLYDRIQKEVINLRKAHGEKDTLLTAKDNVIKMLEKKVEILTKVMAKAKKVREAADMEKETGSVKSDDGKQKKDNTFQPSIKKELI